MSRAIAWIVGQVLAPTTVAVHEIQCSDAGVRLIQWSTGRRDIFSSEDIAIALGWSRAHATRVAREVSDAGFIETYNPHTRGQPFRYRTKR